ncbi:hypothetical protein M0R45_027915 [Rubus argutus]|uniref:Secreted protein n=1 Tax=Rubus argutus TaxID=59490 RepID=A0AAW1W5J4_RUBAR
MKTLRLELMIYAVGSWVVRYTLALREFLMLGKPMFAAGRLPFFCLLSLEIIDTCFPPRACPGHYKYLSILCRVSFIAFSVFYVKGKNGHMEAPSTASPITSCNGTSIHYLWTMAIVPIKYSKQSCIIPLAIARAWSVKY